METLTVGELIGKLKILPKSAKVYMVTDRSDSNWDVENAAFKRVHGIEYVEKEVIEQTDGFTDIEINVLLEIEVD